MRLPGSDKHYSNSSSSAVMVFPVTVPRALMMDSPAVVELKIESMLADVPLSSTPDAPVASIVIPRMTSVWVASSFEVT